VTFSEDYDLSGEDDDLREARRIMDRLFLDESALPTILDEIRGRAARQARERYLEEGAANDGLDWYPGRWGKPKP